MVVERWTRCWLLMRRPQIESETQPTNEMKDIVGPKVEEVIRKRKSVETGGNVAADAHAVLF